MTTVAVTGCASRFAQVLLPLLEADDTVSRIIGIDRVAPQGTYSKLDFREADVRDPDLAHTITGCDALIHLAFIVGRPFAMPYEEAASINLGGTWNVCEAAASVGVHKLVISSSIAAYGILPDNPVPLTEASPLRGLFNDFYYSQHKHANELWLDTFQQRHREITISRLRPCIVMGPHQLAAAVLTMQGDIYLVAESADRVPTQYVHEDDLAAAFHLMVRRDLPGAYNVVGDDPTLMPEMAERAGLRVVEVPIATLREQTYQAWRAGLTIFGPEWQGGGNVSTICANDKLKSTGGWQPRYTSTQAFVTTVEALRTHES